MARAKAAAANPVSLFPFLAVLLCAMGALIFLLIVITQQIREERLATASVAASDSDDPEPPEIIQPPVPELHAPPTLAPTPIVADAGTRNGMAGQIDPDQPVKVPRVYLFRENPPAPPPPDPNQKIRAAYALATQKVETFRARAASGRNRSIALSRSVTALKNELQSADRRRSELQQAIAARDAERLKKETQLARMQAELSKLADEVREKAEQRASEPPKYSVVPFDGATGTTRRPILIECTGEGLTFLNERIDLGGADLNGFTADANPVAAGVDALNAYWKQQDRREPYVLLLVRPEGTVAYYAARLFLGDRIEQTGYELIPDGVEIALPEIDREARDLAVAAMRDIPRSIGSVGRSMGRAPVRNDDPIEITLGERGLSMGGLYEDPTEMTPNYARSETSGPNRNSYGPGNGPASEPRTNPRSPFAPGNNAGRFDRNAGPANGTGLNPSDPSGTGQRRYGDRPSQSGPSGSDFDAYLQAARDRKSGNSTNSPERSRGEEGTSSNSDAPTNPDAKSSGTRPDGRQSLESLLSGAGSQQSRAQQLRRDPLRDQDDNWAPSERSLSSTRAGKASGEPRLLSDDIEETALNGSTRNLPQARGDATLWGSSSRNALIGLERSINVRFYADQLAVGSQSPIKLGRGETSTELLQALVRKTNAETTAWGDPPDGFRWTPQLDIDVMPGGNQHLGRIDDRLSRYGLRTRIERRLTDPALETGN
ncbi:hypothetical protein [Stratiformator vulcanicus]|uniref:Uncharacterized protein n=1 Tax=Stratiformator vulcanicus TaxID=2527980 RepID=A0A517R2Q6_9PLAN|nr:hypothetical protein [Stratiformator vulcanicus]QDT38159.1 hypothetical protein Pan189_25490 [Stratiformator vulcanicus]